MNQHYNVNGLNQQYNNLVNHLLSLGVSADQLYQMSSGQGSSVLPASQTQSNVKLESRIIASKEQDVSYEEGLLLKMFSTFCGEQPQSAKELSIAFTKFARWIQSSVDKANQTSV